MSTETVATSAFNLDSLSEGRVPVLGHAVVDSIKKGAADRLSNTPFPTTRDEEWRFTNIRGITKEHFHQGAQSDVPVANYDTATVPEAKDSTLVFVNGLFNAELSKVDGLPEGVVLESLRNAVHTHPELISTYFNEANTFDDDFFAHLNTAQFEDGAFIFIPKKLKIEQTIHLVYITAGNQTTASFPRNLIVAGQHSEFTVVEEYLGGDSTAYLTTSFSEVFLAEGAHMSHVRLQKDGMQAFHINRLVSSLQRNANLQSYTISLGASVFRNDVRAMMQGEGAHATLDGLVLVNGSQLSDTHSIMDHQVAHCTSHQLHKTIVDDSGTSVFNGKIFVRKDAQKTDAFQENHNLQLSMDGMVYTKPQLEIFADDVKCSHGATVGQINDEQEFYLKSRGLNEQQTREVLTYGFATEVIESLPVESIKEDLRKAVAAFTKRGVANKLLA